MDMCPFTRLRLDFQQAAHGKCTLTHALQSHGLIFGRERHIKTLTLVMDFYLHDGFQVRNLHIHAFCFCIAGNIGKRLLNDSKCMVQ